MEGRDGEQSGSWRWAWWLPLPLGEKRRVLEERAGERRWRRRGEWRKRGEADVARASMGCCCCFELELDF